MLVQELAEAYAEELALRKRATGGDPELLQGVQTVIGDAVGRLQPMLRPAELKHARAVARKEGARLHAVSLATQELSEEHERVARVRQARAAGRRTVANRTMLTHGSGTTSGRTSVWNQQKDADADLSYYERQARKHGRGRRGSTAVAGILLWGCC